MATTRTKFHVFTTQLTSFKIIKCILQVHICPLWIVMSFWDVSNSMLLSVFFKVFLFMFLRVMFLT